MYESIHKKYNDEFRCISKSAFWSLRGYSVMNDADRTNYGDIKLFIRMENYIRTEVKLLKKELNINQSIDIEYLLGVQSYVNTCENLAGYWRDGALLFGLMSSFLNLMPIHSGVIVKILLSGVFALFSFICILNSISIKKRCVSNIGFCKLLEKMK